MKLHRTTMNTPIGELVLIASDEGLREIRLPLPERRPMPRADDAPGHPILRRAVRQLDEYFRGERVTFTIPIDVQGSRFQHEVWRALGAIRYGTTDTYGGLATRVGRPGAARAVGGANGANPLPIIVPCHRVVASTGALTGYAGPTGEGIAMKRWLLDHEAARRHS